MNLQESIRKILREETEDGMKDIMFDIFDENTKGSEIYDYYNSLWMMLPEQKEWVFWIDCDLYLSYNYNFFEKIYKYVSLDVVDNQHYITEWVKDIFKTAVRNTKMQSFTHPDLVEDILKTGVRNTHDILGTNTEFVEEMLKKCKKGVGDNP